MTNSIQDLCPECSKCEGVPIVWGEPSEQDKQRAERGEIVCGDTDFWAAVCGTLMNRECKACGHQWYVHD